MEGRKAKAHDLNKGVTEFENLKSHFATSCVGWGGRRSLPCVFTEHGAIRAASVLNTAKAIEVSVYVVRAFVMIREYLATHKQLAQKRKISSGFLKRRCGRISAMAGEWRKMPFSSAVVVNPSVQSALGTKYSFVDMGAQGTSGSMAYLKRGGDGE
jgi:hypothetical protein